MALNTLKRQFKTYVFDCGHINQKHWMAPSNATMAFFAILVPLIRQSRPTCLKPNSITLASSELAPNKLRTSFERAPN